MPTVLREGPYRFFFVNPDLYEPPQVHVDRDEDAAKCWSEPVALARSLGLRPHELRRLEGIVSEHRDMFLEAWNDFFGT